MSTRILTLVALLLLAELPAVFAAGEPDRWVPARWEGGPLELARRAADRPVLDDQARREAIAEWYSPATLDLLQGTPINCLLVTFSAGAAKDVEIEQQQRIKKYASLARERGIAVMGIVYPGGDPPAIARAAKDAGLDGLVLDGEFPAGFADRLQTLVIPIARDPASVRHANVPLVAVEGAQPSARNMSDTGVRAAPSAEPWIDSNIWLVRSLRLGPSGPMVWVNHEAASISPDQYLRYVADAAAAGGRWIVAIDDDLRTRLFRKDTAGLATWKRLTACLQFAEDHAEWRRFAPYGNLAMIIDPNSRAAGFREEYLNLVARRQVPYRIIERSQLTAAALVGFQAVLAADVSPATPAERKILRDFAEQGGLLVAGASWGNPSKTESYSEVPLGKGRVVVYQDEPPDPEAVAKDLKDLMPPESLGFSVFNVPSAITHLSTSDSGKRVLIQLVNYSDRPYGRVTVRFNGVFKTARLYTPEDAPVDLEPRPAARGRTEVLIAKPVVWGALVLE